MQTTNYYNRHVLKVIILLIVLLFPGFSSSNYCQVNFTDVSNFHRYLDKKEQLYEKLICSLGKAYWNYYSNEGVPDLRETKQVLSDFFNDKEFTSSILKLSEQKSIVQDSMLKRRIEVWQKIIKAAAINFNSGIMKLQNEIEDRLVQMMNKSSKEEAEELERLTLKLIKMRNDKARESGYRNYAYTVLDLSEVDTVWFFNTIKILEEQTYHPYKNLVAEAKNLFATNEFSMQEFFILYSKYEQREELPAIKPDSMISIMRHSLKDIGIEYDELPITKFIDKELPPPAGGNAIEINIPKDIRIIVVPDLSFNGRMHELGHALQWIFTKNTNPVLKGYEWLLGASSPMFAEGMAEVESFFLKNPSWLEKYYKINKDSSNQQLNHAIKYLPAFIRFHLYNSMLEIEIYNNPDQDLVQLKHKLARKYLQIEKQSTRPLRLADNMFVSYPVYKQNYLFADIIAWQVHDFLKNKFGENYIFSPNLGQYLVEYLYEDGEYYNWQQRLIRATGKELDVTGYMKNHLELKLKLK